MRLMQTYSAVY